MIRAAVYALDSCAILFIGLWHVLGVILEDFLSENRHRSYRYFILFIFIPPVRSI